MGIKTKHIEAARELRQWLLLLGTAAYIFLSNDGDDHLKVLINKAKKGARKWLA